MTTRNTIDRRTALQSICIGAGTVLGPGIVTGQNAEKQEVDEIQCEVRKKWESLVRQHGALADYEYAAGDSGNRISSNQELATQVRERRDNGISCMVQRVKFEDGYTTKVRTEIKRIQGRERENLGTLVKEIDGTRFETTIPKSLDRTLRQYRRDRRTSRMAEYRGTTIDSEFAEQFDESEHEIPPLKDNDRHPPTLPQSYEFTSASDGSSNKDCPLACWIQGINFATDTDLNDNRCGVSALDAVVSINADAYAEVYTVFNNNTGTGEFEITFDGYTKGTVSSLGMAAGTEFAGFVRDVNDGTTNSTLLGTLDSNWYDAVDTIDARWGPGHGTGPGGGAPYTDYQLTTELEIGKAYAVGIRMEVNLANISLPGSITINFTDTNNPLDDDFGMSFNSITVDSQ